MADILNFTGITKLDIPVEQVRDNLPLLEGMVIVGFTTEGEEYFASTYADGGDVLWLLERAKKRLLDMPDDY